MFMLTLYLAGIFVFLYELPRCGFVTSMLIKGTNLNQNKIMMVVHGCAIDGYFDCYEADGDNDQKPVQISKVRR